MSEPITDADLDLIESRANAAAPGPWRREGAEILNDAALRPNVDEAGDGIWIYDEGGHAEADAEFIAHARQDVPRLIAEIKRLRSTVDAARCGSSTRCSGRSPVPNTIGSSGSETLAKTVPRPTHGMLESLRSVPQVVNAPLPAFSVAPMIGPWRVWSLPLTLWKPLSGATTSTPPAS